MKKFRLLFLTAILVLFVTTFSVTAFAEETQETETPETNIEQEIPSEETLPALTDEDFNKLVEIMQGIIEKNTSIKQEDIEGISAKLEEYGITISSKMIVIVIGASVVVFLVLMFAIKQRVTISNLKKLNNVQAVAYNNQQALIEATDRENLSKGVSADVCAELAKQNQDLREELAKMHGENEVIIEQNKTMIDAMRTAWGGKVSGINNILTKAPTQASVDALELQIKYYKEYIKSQNADVAESIIVDIEKKAGV